jgi:hypothetical protein
MFIIQKEMDIAAVKVRNVLITGEYKLEPGPWRQEPFQIVQKISDNMPSVMSLGKCYECAVCIHAVNLPMITPFPFKNT